MGFYRYVEIIKVTSSVYKKFTVMVLSAVSTRCHKTISIKEETEPAGDHTASQDTVLLLLAGPVVLGRGGMVLN